MKLPTSEDFSVNNQKGSPRFAGEAGFAPIILVIVMIIVIAGIGGAFYFYTQSKQDNTQIAELPSPTNTLSPLLLPTHQPEASSSGNLTNPPQFKKRQIDLAEMKKGMFGKGYPDEITSIPDEQLAALSCNTIHNSERRQNQDYDFASRLPTNLAPVFPMMKNSRVKDIYGIVGIIDDVVYCTTEDSRSIVVITNYTDDGEGSGDDVYFWQSQGNKQPSLLGKITAESDRFDCSGPGPIELTKDNIVYYKCDYTSGAGFLYNNESVYRVTLSPFSTKLIKNCSTTDNSKYPGVRCN